MNANALGARNALAQPQAIEFSLAIPTIRPLLPSRSLAFTAGSIATPFLFSDWRLCVQDWRNNFRSTKAEDLLS
jgi:hypothetical protein